MTKLIGLLSACAVAALGIAACTVTSDSSGGSFSDGGKSDGSSSSDSSSTGDTSTTSDGGGDSGSCKLSEPFSNEGACNTCAEQSCCAEVNACLADAECVAIDECVAQCGSIDGGADAGGALKDCQDVCFAAHAATKDKWIDFNNCIAGSCSAQCN